MKLEKEEQKFMEYIHDVYGTGGHLADQLDLGVEMLFYIEEGTFDRKEVQNVVSAIRSVIQVLRREN